MSLETWNKNRDMQYLTQADFVPSYTSQLITARVSSSGVFVQHEFPLLKTQGASRSPLPALHSQGGLQSGSEANGSSQMVLWLGEETAIKTKVMSL